MAAAVMSAPRYSADDFETMSIRSAAPSYISEAPSYHSTDYRGDPTPAYSGPAAGSGQARSQNSPSQQRQRQQPQTQQRTIGLPPLPPLASGMGTLNIHNYRLPTWSTNNAPAARQINSVIERRANAERERQKAARAAGRLAASSSRPAVDRSLEHSSSPVLRPLEDPYLVGEQAAAQARRERLNRETGDDILIKEDKQWDWLLVQMKNSEARDREFSRFRRAESGSRRTLLRRMGDRMI